MLALGSGLQQRSAARPRRWHMPPVTRITLHTSFHAEAFDPAQGYLVGTFNDQRPA